ncbi:MAG TPA: preprotein translocase subunit SecG [Candidatus Eisenbacteria bacterium]|jgi:preprotein translocase subunit SecG|nr:preprotein translocase subunit SecG [Candidatus Eisenbacteria bacterium]
MSGILTGLITTLHILACVSLMVAILLQSGKGGGLAGTFGAGSSQTLFGGRGAATFLSRAAGTLAVVFFLTSLTLGLTSTRQNAAGGRSLITEEAKRRAGQGQRPAESNAPPPLGGATTPGQGLTPPAASPTQPPAQQAPTTNAPSTNTTAPTPPATEGNTTTQGGP